MGFAERDLSGRLALPIKFVMVVTMAISSLVLFLHFIDTNLLLEEESITSMRIDLRTDVLFAEADKEQYFLVFVIPTLPQHVAQRTTIRATWGNISGWQDLQGVHDQYKRIKIMFVVGQLKGKEYPPEFVEEAAVNDDIFICKGIDEHRTVLKYKVLWGMLRSIALYDYTYFIKTDDDILVNMPLLIQGLITKPRTNLYTGNCGRRYGGFAGYPRWRYCSGGGYIISRDVIKEISTLEPDVHRVRFRPEDAYSGYLIYLVSTLKGYDVKTVFQQDCLKLSLYSCGLWKHWFYHREGVPAKMKDEFYKINKNITTVCMDEEVAIK